jgi:protein-disulfide isomerase
LAAGADDRATNSGPVVVEIDGVKFTAADVQRKNASRLFQARTALFDAERKTVDEFINDYLLEREAKKESVTVEELVRRHVDSAVAKDPSEEALRVYYDGVDTTESYEAVREKIIETIRERRAAKAKTAYIQALRRQASVGIHLNPPRVTIALENTPIRGSSDAPVKLVEFADYECPACQQIQPTIDKLLMEYKGRIAYAYKDFPLPQHPNAQKAAEATHCARVQGQYWEYHDLLNASKQYDPAKLKEHARTLKLDGSAFDKCLDSGAQAAVVKTNLDEAIAFGLPGTPGIFINGRFVNVPLDYQTLRQALEEELRLASSGSKGTVASNVQ